MVPKKGQKRTCRKVKFIFISLNTDITNLSLRAIDYADYITKLAVLRINDNDFGQHGALGFDAKVTVHLQKEQARPHTASIGQAVRTLQEGPGTSEVVFLFLEDGEVGRVALSCHLSMDFYAKK